jgi:rhamnosyltransferase
MYKVQILLSTYNGEKYLYEQIDSLLKQEDVSINILVRDDESSDNTVKILEKYQSKGLLTWYVGKNLGPAKSFMDLISKASNADYYAFCDQDDIWLQKKLKASIEFLSCLEKDIPGLYFSNTTMVNSDLKSLPSPAIRGLFTFGESLIRNSAIGCTVVFNARLLYYLKLYVPQYLIMHDYWAYQICLALGGKIYYDKNSYIKYRQHGYNVVGGKETFLSMLKRRYGIFFKNNSGTRLLNAQSIFSGYSDIMSSENKKIVDDIVNYKKTIRNKIRIIFNSKYRTVNMESNIGFIISILFNKF